jgi:hypothetical protein
MNINSLIAPVLGLALLALAGCSRHHESAPPAQPPKLPPTTVISGLASKGPINAGFVDVFAIRSGVTDMSAPIARGLTDADGRFTVDLGAYEGPVMVVISEGTFTDEVSGKLVALKQPMRAMVSLASIGTSTAAVTPLTELAAGKAEGDGLLTPEAIDDANAKISSLFQLGDIVKTLPLAGGAADQKKYADSCGVISQLANDSKQAGESLDDGLARVMGEMENELKQNHVFSNDSLAKINAAVAKFDNKGAGASAVLPTSGRLTISTSGPTSMIGAIGMTVILPDGITVASDPATGEAFQGAVAVSGAAAIGAVTLVTANVVPVAGSAPARVIISMSNATGFGIGECVTIDFTRASGAAFPANAGAFTLAGVTVKGTGGLPLTGVTVAPTGLSGL